MKVIVARFLVILSFLGVFQAGSIPVMRRKVTETVATNTTTDKKETAEEKDAAVPLALDGAVDGTVNETAIMEQHASFLSAVVHNDAPLVQELLQQNASLATVADHNGWLPLHEVAHRGHVETLRELLKYSKEHINARTDNGGSVLYWAIEAGYGSEHPLVQELVANGAINYPPESSEIATNVTTGIVRKFVTAAGENDVDTLKKLLDEYPEVMFHSDEHGFQALHEAARTRSSEAALYLLENGAEVHTRTGPDFDGPTALYWALESGLTNEDPVVQALWKAGAIPLEEGDLVTFEHPPKGIHEFEPSELSEAVRSGDCDTLFELASARPAWLRIMDENGWLPLHEAAVLGSVHCVSDILEIVGEDDFINVRVGGTGGSALWWALQELGESSEMVQFLIENGAQALEPIQEEL